MQHRSKPLYNPCLQGVVVGFRNLLASAERFKNGWVDLLTRACAVSRELWSGWDRLLPAPSCPLRSCHVPLSAPPFPSSVVNVAAALHYPPQWRCICPCPPLNGWRHASMAKWFAGHLHHILEGMILG
jgi:hypothetical protein